MYSGNLLARYDSILVLFATSGVMTHNRVKLMRRPLLLNIARLPVNVYNGVDGYIESEDIMPLA